MGNRTLIRPDGSTVTVPDSDAGHLQALGYKEQTGGEAFEEGRQAGEAAHYDTPWQKYLTLTEGANSGGSLGLTDFLAGEETRNRAHYNPGTRLTGEVLGMLAGSIEGVPTPVRGLTELAELGGETLGQGSKLISTLARGGIEGAGFGAAGAITTAKLDGDPITAQAVLAGMGQGALWGGGLAGLGEGVASRLEARAERLAAEKLAPTSEEIIAREGVTRAEADARVASAIHEGISESGKEGKMVEDIYYGKLKSTLKDAETTLRTATKGTEDAVKDISFLKADYTQKTIYSRLADQGILPEVRTEARNFQKSFSLAQQAARDGNYEKMIKKLEDYKEAMIGIETKVGVTEAFNAQPMVKQANELIGFAKARIDLAAKGAETVAAMNSVHVNLAEMPKNIEEFKAMRGSRIEKIAASVDALGKLKNAELAGVQESVVEAIDHMSKDLGVTMEGTPGERLKGIWKIVKENGTRRAKDALESASRGNLLWEKANKAREGLEKVQAGAEAERTMAKGSKMSRLLKHTLGYEVGAWTGRKLGIGYPGYVLGHGLTLGLIGMKGAVLGTLAQQAMKFTPKAMRALEKAGPRLEPLARRLDGSIETKEKDRKKLMDLRMKEISEAAPSMRDTLFRSVQPVGIEHPEFAQALHSTAVARFQLLLEKMPKDPGLAYSKLKSMWKADPVETEKFSRYYEAFHDPVGVLSRAVQTGKLTNEAAEFISQSDPDLWNHFRTELLMRASDPEINSKLTYQDQVHLSTLTGITFHASMDPRFISAQQQMHTERNQPLKMNPQIQPGGGAGRPSGPGPNATAAQKIEQH